MEERVRFLSDWSSGDWNMAELCRFYGVTRATGYKWVRRYEAGGLEALQDQSRAPHSHPNQLPSEVEEQILALREKHPTWGAPKIRGRLKRVGDAPLPAESTVGAVLRRHGLTVPNKRRRSARPSQTPLVRPGHPNHVWSADFKGWFRTRDGVRVEPLTLADGYSRYLLRCQALRTADYAHTKPVFEAAFREFGLPERLRSDNGAPFGSNGESGLTRLSVWLIKLGIVPEHIEPGKPQQNGRHERMHRTLKAEATSPPQANPRAQQRRFDQFRREYNEERPHESLGQRPPAEFWQPSCRLWPGRLRDVEYPDGWQVRRVSDGGQISWLCDRVFVAHALEGEAVGLEPVGEDLWQVWFSFYDVGLLEEKKNARIRRSPRPEPAPEEEVP